MDLLKCNDKETLLNATWSNSLLQLSFELLAFYTQIERIGDFEELLPKTKLVDMDAPFGVVVYNWTAINILSHCIQSLNVTANELKQKCGNEFKKVIIIELEYINKTTNGSSYNTSLLDSVRETTSISGNSICYKLHFNEHMFRSKKDEVFMYINRDLLPENLEKNSSLTIDLNGRDINLNEYFAADGSIISAQFGEMTVAKIRIAAYYDALSYDSNGALKCSRNVTLEDCQDHCRIQTIERYCNCTPVSWSKLTASTEEYCTLDDYMNLV